MCAPKIIKNYENRLRKCDLRNSLYATTDYNYKITDYELQDTDYNYELHFINKAYYNFHIFLS